MRRLAILTSDFALYHDVVRYVRERSIPFESLAFGEKPGPHVGVIVTSWRDVLRKDLPEGLPVVAVPVDTTGKEDVAVAVAQAQRLLEGVAGYKEVVMGIDPGKRPGVALLGDGRVLHTAQVFSPHEVAPLLSGLLTQFPADRYVIRLGHGAPKERDDILHALSTWDRTDVRLELVNETGTTLGPGQRGRLTRDVAAALEIARTPGRAAPRAKRYVSAGQIREIQRESRVQSEGRLTISRDLARLVARGDLTLAQALEREGAVKGPKNR